VEEARIEVRLKPRASRDELLGLRDGVLQASVCAAPVDGEANAALCRLIARHAGVAPSRVELIRGEHARLKLLRVIGLDQRDLEQALGLAL
jgi:uncharacterized protein YggU (UPF0235/DUF167 family)